MTNYTFSTMNEYIILIINFYFCLYYWTIPGLKFYQTDTLTKKDTKCFRQIFIRCNLCV